MKLNNRIYLFSVAALFMIGLISIAWQSHQPAQIDRNSQDTVPLRKKITRESDIKNQKDFDKELQDLDNASKELDHLPDIDFKKIQEEIQLSLKEAEKELAKNKIDMEGIQREIRESLKNIDVEKMKKDLKESLDELDKADMHNLNETIEKAFEKVQNVDQEKIAEAIDKSLSKVDMDKIHKEIQHAMEEVEKHKDHFQIDMSSAKKDIEKAKSEIKGYKEMTDEMEKEGLINKEEDYRIEYNDGDLTINGKKQSESVASKYKKYFPRKHVTINKEKGEMNINIQ